MTTWRKCQRCGKSYGFDEEYLASAEYVYCSDECENQDREESQ